jgi:hypothetical protein
MRDYLGERWFRVNAKKSQPLNLFVRTGFIPSPKTEETIGISLGFKVWLRI